MKAKSNKKVLIAGVGNDLRQDDAFGLAVAKRLNKEKLPEDATVQEVGIGGIHLVQELHNGYDVLIILDAVQWGGSPGRLHLREAETEDIMQMPKEERLNFLADMHYTSPVRALMLAKALNVLPNRVYILGCEAKLVDDFDMGMSQEVQNAIDPACKTLLKILNESINKHEKIPENFIY